MTDQTTTTEGPQAVASEVPQEGASGTLTWPVWLGLGVALAAAVVASWSTLAGVALATGWAPRVNHLLPASVDVTAAVSGWVWIRGQVAPHVRSYARALTYVAGGASIGGNALGHLVAEGVLDGSWWPLIVAVGAVPAVMLVTLVHLAALLAEGPEALPAEAPQVVTAPEVTVATEVPRPLRPSPAAPSRPRRPAPQRPDSATPKTVIVTALLEEARTPDQVPFPAAIRKRWKVSKSTAERARADVLAALNPTAQEA